MCTPTNESERDERARLRAELYDAIEYEKILNKDSILPYPASILLHAIQDKYKNITAKMSKLYKVNQSKKKLK